MPRARRIPKRRIGGDQLTLGQLLHLITGYDFFGDGFGRKEKADMEAMRAAWRAHREYVWAETLARFGPTREPWATRFDADG